MSITGLRYGTIAARMSDDVLVVDRADPIVAVTMELLIEWAKKDVIVSSSYGGVLIAGVRYWPVGVDEGRNLVLQRVDDEPLPGSGGA